MFGAFTRRLAARRFMFMRERGGSTMITFILAPTVLIGFGALVVDVGAIRLDEGELRNGADAAALAIARNCIVGNCNLNDGASTYAGTFGNANAADNAANVVSVCGTGTGLSACTGVTPPTNARGYVRVTLKTKDAASGSDKVPFRLAKVLGFSGATGVRTSSVAWGPPATGTAIPLTFSECEYIEALGSRSSIPSGPPFDNATYPQQVIYFHGSEPAGECPAGPSGADVPGGFGWLESTGCVATVAADSYVEGKPGNGVPNGCNPADWQNKTLLLPIFDEVDEQGSNSEYHIKGFASFYIEGYRFSGETWPSGFQCPEQPGASGRCIAGHFTSTSLLQLSTSFGSTDFGTNVARFFE